MIPLWLITGSGALAAGILAGTTLAGWRWEAKLNAAERGFATERAAAAQALADEQATHDKLTQTLINDHEAKDEEAKTKLAALASERDRAAAQRDGLLRARDSAVAAARRCAPGGATAQPAGQTTSGDPIGVLADVLGRADQRAGELADIADRRLVGWQACAGEYEAVRRKFSEQPH